MITNRSLNLGTETAFSVLAKANILAEQGKEIINLGIGQPDFLTPKHIVLNLWVGIYMLEIVAWMKKTLDTIFTNTHLSLTTCLKDTAMQTYLFLMKKSQV